MLLRVGKLIFNTDLIMLAEFDDADEAHPHLYLRLGGGGERDATFTPLRLWGEAARRVWEILERQATPVTPAQPAPAGDGGAEPGA